MRWHLGLILSVAFPASAIDGSQTVKVTSQLCGHEKGLHQGSGLAFSSEGRNYVLTSEHVVLHGNEEYCHAIWSETLEKHSARLVVAEYGNGLALLEVNDLANSFPDLSAIEIEQAQSGTAVRLLGYNHGQEQLIQSALGSVLLPKSARIVVPLLPDVIETVDAYGGFGMSGGPAVTRDGKWIGILSHRPLRNPPGKPAGVGKFEEGKLERHLLVISATNAKTWVDHVLKSAEPVAAYFVRDPEEQLKGKEVVISSGVRFDLEDANSPVNNGVGGSEGVGSGGPTSVFDGRMVLRLDTHQSNTVWYLPGKAQWLSRLRTHLREPGRAVIVPFFLPETEPALRPIGFRSHAEFFALLRDVTRTPRTIGLTAEDGMPDAGPLVALGESLKERSVKLKALAQNASTKALLDEVELAASLMNDKDWVYLRRAHIRRICSMDKEYKNAWKEIFSRDFDLAAQTLKELHEVEAILKELEE